MEAKQIMSISLTVLGVGMMIWGGLSLAGNGGKFFGEYIGKWGSVIPLIIGIIFFTYGIKLFASVGSSKKGTDTTIHNN